MLRTLDSIYDHLFQTKGRAKVTHILLLFLRFLCIFFPGYPHPDEFFQSQEIAAADVFNFEVFIPWEFTPTQPCRSIFPPLLGSGIAFSFLQFFSVFIPFLTNAYTLLYLPRIVIFLLSLLMDYSTATICYWVGKSTGHVLCILSSSWVMLIFHTRPFSNTIESILLACGFLVFFLPKETLSPSQRDWRHIGIGIIFSLGIFTRFTYCLFFFPIALSLLYEFYTFEVVTTGWEASGIKIKKISRVKSMFRSLGLITLGFSAVSGVIVILDSIYFGSLQITVLNSFLYNLDSSNLAQHGLHPRYLHLLVNMNILFGPLYLCGVISSLVISVKFIISYKNGDEKPSSKKIEERNTSLVSKYMLRVSAEGNKIRRNKTAEKMVRIVLMSSIISGACLLSLAVHQEPRFLIPLILPLSVLFGDILAKNKYLLSSWIFFNLILLVFYGIMHQGGVIQSLIYFQRTNYTNTTLVYHNTYMPPRFLLAQTKLQENIHVVDVGSKTSELYSFLAEYSQNTCENNVSSVQTLFILLPHTSSLDERLLPPSKHSLFTRFWPNFSSEAPPHLSNFMNSIYLDVFQFTPLCA